MNRVRVDIPYQKKHSRISVLLRPILTIPIMVVMMLMIVPNHTFNMFRVGEIVQEQTIQSENAYYDLFGAAVNAKEAIQERLPENVSVGNQKADSGIVTGVMYLGIYLLAVSLIAFSLWGLYVINIAVMLTLLFCKKYPSWWFNWNQALQSFVLRIYCFSMFLTDKYPSLEVEDSPIKLHLPNPVGQNLNRFLPLIKWLLVLPMLAVYLVCLMGSFLLIPVTFVSILITGKLPRWIYRIQVAIIHFYLQITAYAFLLVTDRYPLYNRD